MNLFKRAALIALTTLGLSTLAYADPYKEVPKTVNFIMPYSVGGIVDAQFKHFEQYMAGKGVTLIGLYRPGANSLIATQELLDKPKDGSSLIMNSTSNAWLSEQRLGRKAVDPLLTTGGTVSAIITYPGSKFETLDSMLAGLKAGDPDLKIGWHAVSLVLNINRMTTLVGGDYTKVTTVPYKTPVDSSRDVAGKHIPLAIVPMTTARGLADAGKIKIVAVYGTGAGKVDLPDGVVDLKTKIPGWAVAELFFIGVAEGTDEKAKQAWISIFRDYLGKKETVEYLHGQFFAVDIKDTKGVNNLISSQGESIKKFNVVIK